MAYHSTGEQIITLTLLTEAYIHTNGRNYIWQF